jgi:hypothetical protein
MKRLIYSILFIVAMGMYSVNAGAQTFSKMSESKRNTELIKIAEKVYKSKKFAQYYNDKTYGGNHGEPTVKSLMLTNSISSFSKQHDVGKLQYIVTLYMKQKVNKYKSTPGNKVYFDRLPSARVYISDKFGKAWMVKLFDNNIMYLWDDFCN